MSRKISLRALLLLQGAVVIYSFADIAAKLASAHAFLSLPYLMWIGAEILILGVYAICWQQIIKRVDISIAYSNRAAAIVWTTLWAALVFHERVSLQNLLGLAVIFAGIWMVNRDAE